MLLGCNKTNVLLKISGLERLPDMIKDGFELA